MMDSAIVMTYTRAAPGRELQALEAFTEGMAFFGTASHDGVCGEPISVMGMTGHNFMLIPGEYEKLAHMVRTDEFRELFMKAVFAVPDIGYEIAAFGQGVQDSMARWSRVGAELAYL